MPVWTYNELVFPSPHRFFDDYHLAWYGSETGCPWSVWRQRSPYEPRYVWLRGRQRRPSWGVRHTPVVALGRPGATWTALYTTSLSWDWVYPLGFSL